MIGLLYWVAIALVGGSVLTFIALWTYNYRRTESAERATERSTRRFVGLASAGLLSVFIGLSQLAGVLGTGGDIVATWPGAIAQFILGGLAVAGFAGWIEISAVGATLIVSLVIIGYVAISN